MRFILKGPPPKEAARLHAQKAKWGEDGPGDKKSLREAAITEQRGLCAYCNGRLRRDHTTTLEHWLPRSVLNNLDTSHFEWRNLLAVCPGGQHDERVKLDGRWVSPLHCDKSRRDHPLTLNPASPSPDTEALVRYLPDGRVKATDPAYEAEILTTLNLNAATLVRNRRAAIDALLSSIERAHGKKEQADQLKKLEELLRPYETAIGDLPSYPLAVLPHLHRAIRIARERDARLKQSR